MVAMSSTVEGLRISRSETDASRTHWGSFYFGANPDPFCLCSFFSHDKYSTNSINDKNLDGVLGTRTRGGRMVGAYKSTELWRHPYWEVFKYNTFPHVTGHLDMHAVGCGEGLEHW